MSQILKAIMQFIDANMEYLWIGTILLVIFLLVMVISLVVKQHRLARKYDRFMRGSDAENLEKSFFEAYDAIKDLQYENMVNKEDISHIKEVMGKTFQRMSVVRYNAFPGMGGNSSCAVALLTQSLDGMVLNIVHNRENCYFYVKVVNKGEPEVLLGKEERAALEEALKEKPVKL